jgi:hypothetical protein
MQPSCLNENLDDQVATDTLCLPTLRRDFSKELHHHATTNVIYQDQFRQNFM